MSPRLVILLALAGIIAIGAGVVTWTAIQPHPAPLSGNGAATPQPAPDAERRERREKFFSGDPDRDVRGGQEMKPQW